MRHILLTLLISYTLCIVCPNPQRIGFFSFEALSNRDHLTNLFENMTKKAPTYNISWRDTDGSLYNMTDIRVGYWYNDLTQSEMYVDQYTAHVTSGALTVSLMMNYSIRMASGSLLQGQASLKVKADSFFFQKSIDIQEGNVSWKPKNIQKIGISTPLVIEWSNPKLPYENKKSLENILNGYAGDRNLKEEIVNDLNKVYVQDLTAFLNSQVMFHTSNLIYTYQGLNVTFLNLVSDIGLKINNTFKGLEFKFQFQVENFTTKCNELPKEYNKQFGGLQEYFDFDFMRQATWYAASKGSFNRMLDNRWDTEVFQFYAGDLMNAVAGLKDKRPDTPVGATCRWNNSLINVDISLRNNSGIMADLPYTCNVYLNQSGKATSVFDVHFIVAFYIKIVAEQDFLDFVVADAGILTPTFSGPYQVTSYSIATFYMQKIAKSFINHKVFGSGFPLIHRNYGSIMLTSEYLLVYDPSEPF